MNLKRTMTAIPLAAAIMVPAAPGLAAEPAEEGKTGAKAEEMGPSVSTPAADLRATLDQYLSEHAYLAVVTMQKGIDGAEDFDAAASALEENTEDLTGAISSVYGEEAGEQFNNMWSEHIGYFVDYVNAAAEDNDMAQKEALNALDNYRADFSEFLETATNERLEASALAEGLQMHVNQLIGSFDNYEAGNYEEAYSDLRASMEHMYGVGKGLSTAVTNQFPEDFGNTSPATPAADLRAGLNHTLSEHAALAVLAMQKGGDGAEDFENAAAALQGNTEDLAAQIGSVYGKQAQEDFKMMWEEHIGYFVDYVEAAGAGDEEAKEQALSNLDEYRMEFSKFLETATEGELNADNLAQGLQMHVDQLTGSFDSYMAGDYEMAYDQMREAYGHMFGVGEGLSGAIVSQHPSDFETDMPSEMPKTGMGGTSDSSGTGAWMMAWSSMIVVSAGLFIGYRRKKA